MSPCLAEQELLELVEGERRLEAEPALEQHLADCEACSELLATLASEDRRNDARNADLSGERLGSYELRGLIGRGSMGAVYRAWDPRLGRAVAIKVLSRAVAGQASWLRRFETEVRALASIAHQNVVTIHDAGTKDGVPYIVSELLEGESLRSVIDRRGVERSEALRLVLGLARGLAAVHARGVVHRDLKPQNLIVLADGTLKIVDFGLSKRTEESRAAIDATEPGTLLGTAGYLAPEQARGEPADSRSDIFAAGAILYELLSGERAFAGETFAERVSAVLRDRPPLLDEKTLGDAAAVVERCLEKNPDRRFQSADDLAWVLENLRERSQSVVRPIERQLEKGVLARGGISRRAWVLGALASAAAGAAIGRYALPQERARSVSYQQLTYRHGRVGSARFTREGGSAVYAAAWDGLPLSVLSVRLGGGGTRELGLPSADVLSISARGELAVCLGRRFVVGMHTSGRLAVVPLEGGTPRVLAEDVQEADYTPDGAALAVLRRHQGKFRVELPLGRVLFESEAWLSHLRVAPDGRHVGFLLHPSVEDDAGSAAFVGVERGHLRVVRENLASAFGLAWAPSADALLVTGSERGGNNAVRSITLAGKESVMLQSSGRLRIHDVASDGRLLVSQDDWRLRMMVKPAGVDHELDLSLSNVSLVSAISADGGSVLFGEFGEEEMAQGGYLRPTAGGAALRVGQGMPLALSSDARLVVSLLAGTPARVVLYDVESGPPQELSVAPLESIVSARFGERELWIEGAGKAAPRRLWRLPLDGGPLVPITEEGDAGRPEISPDRARAAFVTESGALRLLELTPPFRVRSLPGTFSGLLVSGFQQDGSLLLRNTEHPVVVRRVDLESGRLQEVQSVAPPALGLRGLDAFVLSAGSDAYAYSYGQELSRLYAVSFPEVA